MKTRTLINIITILLMTLPLSMMAQSDWQVSEAKQNQKNPIDYSEESYNAGKVVYLANCKSCHGDPGKNNGLPLVPKPTDFANQAFQDANTDGSIYNKITDGRATMPAYGAILSEKQRGDVVNYIRSFDANFKAPQASTVTVIKVVDDKEIGAPYYLDVQVDESTQEVTASLLGTFKGEKKAIADAELFIGIKRYFNNLPIMDAGALTNAEGIMKAYYPADLPSGEEGIGELLVYAVDLEKYGELSHTTELKLTAVQPSHFNETRALWANRSHFPLWLLITYLSLVGIVYGVLLKVVLNIFKLKKMGH